MDCYWIPEIKSSLKEIDNVLLRNLSLISHLYLYTIGKETLKEFGDFATSGTPSITFETKSGFNNPLIGGGKLEAEEKKEAIIKIDSIYNNDLYFCMDLKALWKLLRESGLVTADFTLSNFNRLLYQNMNNYIEMFYIPDYLLDSTVEDKKRIYTYLFNSINKCKNDFYNKYKSQIQAGNISVGQSIINEELCKRKSLKNSLEISLDKKNEIKENELKEGLKIENLDENNEDENKNDNKTYLPKDWDKGASINYHEGKNIIMLRYFYEVLIRIAYLKFNDISDMTLDQKMKLLFNHFKLFFKLKKKALDNSLAIAANLEIKLTKNLESSVDEFYEKNKIRLNKLYDVIYSKYVCEYNLPYISYDKVVPYRYIFYKIIKENEQLSNIFKNKKSFLNIITIHFKDKFLSINDNLRHMQNKSSLETIFQAAKASSSGNHLNTNSISHHLRDTSSIGGTQNITKSIINDQIQLPENDKGELEVDSNETILYIEQLMDIEMIPYEFYEMMFIICKKYEKIYEKPEGDYNECLSLFEDIVYKNKEDYIGKGKYVYPVLNSHLILQRANEIAEERRRQEELRRIEIKRFETERKYMEDEDKNIYVEKHENMEEEEAEDSEMFN